MRLRNIKNAKEKIMNSEYVIKNPYELKGKYNSIFENNNQLHIEIGMGKGKFLIEMALKYPDINFIGIEKYESILLRAVEKQEIYKLKNLKFICLDALNLSDVFFHEISCIYLNFSDPWPKKRHQKRRLTSLVFLDIYENLFKDEKVIIQKTDNIELFASSIKNINNYGYKFDEVSLDLANTDIENVETEYEMKFKRENIKINYLKAVKK